jgi:hypothetical protein
MFILFYFIVFYIVYFIHKAKLIEFELGKVN